MLVLDMLDLDPHVPAMDFLRQRLTDQSALVRDYWTQLQTGQDPERSTHQLRVHIRRLRSSLPFLERFYGRFYPRYIRKSLGLQVRATNELRDLQVMLRTLEDFSRVTFPGQPRLEWENDYKNGPNKAAVYAPTGGVRSSLNVQERPQFDDLAIEVRGRTQDWLIEMQHHLQRTQTELNSALFTDPHQKSSVVSHLDELSALLRLPPRYDGRVTLEQFGRDSIQQQFRRIEPRIQRFAELFKKPVWLHDLRIEFKKLRYVTDLFAGVPLAHADRLVTFARKCQSRLGEIHDCDIITARLQVLTALPAEGRQYFHTRLLEKRNQALQKLIRRLIKNGYAARLRVDAGMSDAEIQEIKSAGFDFQS
ncbi:MAG: CHAD domain-containing protein [Leptospiraceae bacterium]|nr:CHAD domain-containing protein [Leptospiraceae bacterium]